MTPKSSSFDQVLCKRKAQVERANLVTKTLQILERGQGSHHKAQHRFNKNAIGLYQCVGNPNAVSTPILEVFGAMPRLSNYEPERIAGGSIRLSPPKAQVWVKFKKSSSSDATTKFMLRYMITGRANSVITVDLLGYCPDRKASQLLNELHREIVESFPVRRRKYVSEVWNIDPDQVKLPPPREPTVIVKLDGRLLA
jgi:hypothetical protein